VPSFLIYHVIKYKLEIFTSEKGLFSLKYQKNILYIVYM